MKDENKIDAYSIITDRICAILETGVAPWQKPWRVANGQAPANFISRKPYRGINAFLLLCTPYECPYFVTYKQATELGGNVKKGEKGFPVVFWTRLPKKENGKPVFKNGKPELVFFLRYYTVFNLEQTEGIAWEKPVVKEVSEFEAIASCEAIVAGMPNAPVMQSVGGRAYYSPSRDVVNMPAKATFESETGYYSTLFHELTHSTGHKSRLARKGFLDGEDKIAAFGSGEYSREELVAEMGASFLCGHAGILHSTVDNSASYCASWIKALKGDSKLIVSAAAQAQKASDYILAVTFEEKAE